MRIEGRGQKGRSRDSCSRSSSEEPSKSHRKRCKHKKRRRLPLHENGEEEEKGKRREVEDERRKERRDIEVKVEPQSEDDSHLPAQYSKRRRRNPSDSDSEPRERSRWDQIDTSDQDGRDGKRRDNKVVKVEKEEEMEWGKAGDRNKKPMENKAKPDFGLSGKLAEEVNMFNGVVIKYSEPAEARKPKVRWRLYQFKGDEVLPTLYIHRQSAYLIGRDRKVADIPVDHPSCSKQHAALQYRLVEYQRKDGRRGRKVRPYILDLESANGTWVNNVRIEPKRYVELFERDVLKFGFSSRDYVLLHEHSNDQADS